MCVRAANNSHYIKPKSNTPEFGIRHYAGEVIKIILIIIIIIIIITSIIVMNNKANTNNNDNYNNIKEINNIYNITNNDIIKTLLFVSSLSLCFRSSPFWRVCVCMCACVV